MCSPDCYWCKSAAEEEQREQIYSNTKGGEKGTMQIFEVGFNRLPCLKAQENGEVPTVLVPVAQGQVIAANQNAAIAIAALTHAETLAKAKVKGPELSVTVRPIGPVA